MSQEELLATWIRQLERRPKDLEHARKIMEATRVKNKIRFDKTHRLHLKKIEEGDWVLVYDNSPDNQHRMTRKFARRWFRPYMVMSATNNATYHLAKLDGSRLAIPIAGKTVKIIKKRQDEGPNLDDLNNEGSTTGPTNVSKVDEDMEEIDRSL